MSVISKEKQPRLQSRPLQTRHREEISQNVAQQEH